MGSSRFAMSLGGVLMFLLSCAVRVACRMFRHVLSPLAFVQLTQVAKGYHAPGNGVEGMGGCCCCPPIIDCTRDNSMFCTVRRI